MGATSIIDNTDHVTKTGAKVMVNGDVMFTTTGDVLIYAMASECYTANDTTATLIQYNVTNNNTATSQTISAATTTLASKTVGTSILLQLGSVANAPVITTASGVGAFPWGAIRVPGGSTINLIVSVGSTTGTWKHYIRYEPMEVGAMVVAAY
jgi:hypothetical protein